MKTILTVVMTLFVTSSWAVKLVVCVPDGVTMNSEMGLEPASKQECEAMKSSAKSQDPTCWPQTPPGKKISVSWKGTDITTKGKCPLKDPGYSVTICDADDMSCGMRPIIPSRFPANYPGAITQPTPQNWKDTSSPTQRFNEMYFQNAN